MNTPFLPEKKLKEPGFDRHLKEIWIAIGMILLLTMGVSLARIRVDILPPQQSSTGPVWGKKPVLGYFLLTTSLSDSLRTELNLTEPEYSALRRVAKSEAAQIQALEMESAVVLQDMELTLAEKRAWIEESGYNQQILKILDASQQSLQRVLSPLTFRRLVNWIEGRWQIERRLYGSPVKASGARTFRVYATRFDSGGSYIVALPDKCVKFSNAGNSVCADEGYYANQNYSVSLKYKSGTTAKVLESGPWNIDDTYWATSGDPTPRRMFTDLPLGMPEAQAAYFNNYNGGLDQFGRMVSAPFGIDLARKVSIDIGLEPGNNDWIDVTFLWTKGWEGGSEDGSTAQGSVPEVIIPVETATMMPDGSIIHEVQQGQALLHISKAYAVELSQIFELNELTFDSIIQPGDKLIVQPAQKTLTPSPDISLERVEAQDEVQTTSKPTRTPVQKTDTPEATIAARLDPTQPKSENSTISQQLISSTEQLGVDIILIVIVVLVLIGMVLLLFGRSMKGKS
jgi:hypothetical protein